MSNDAWNVQRPTDAQASVGQFAAMPMSPGTLDRSVPPPPPPMYAVGDVVNGHMWNGTVWIPMHAAPPVAAAQPVVINNNVSSSATAIAATVATRPYRKHSLWAHFWLFMFTAGIGNYFYWRSVSKWNHGR